MKPGVIFISFVFFFGLYRIAGQNRYLALSAGYALPIGGSTEVNKKAVNGASTSTYKPFNLGSGYNILFNFGHHVKENSAIEFSFAYRWHYSVFESEQTMQLGVNTEKSLTTETNTMQMTQVSLGIRVISVGTKIKKYLRTGVNLGITPVWINNYEYSDNYGSGNSEKITFRYYSGFAVGFYTAAGLTIPFYKRSSFSVEVFANAQSWSPWYGKYMYVEEDGKDITSTINPRDIYYVRKTNFSNPKEAIKFHVPMSNFGFNVGWHYALKQKEKKPS